MSGKRRLLRWVWRGVAALLVAAALVLTLVRLLVPFVGSYRAEIEARASRALGMPLRIGGIDARWAGTTVEVALRDVRILAVDGGGRPLRLQEVRARLGILALLAGRIKPRAVLVQGVRVLLRRGPDGSWSMVGLGFAGTGTGQGLPDGLLVVLRDAELVVELAQPAMRQTVTVSRLALAREGTRVRLEGRLAAAGLGAVRILGDVGLAGDRPDEGRLYVEAEDVELEAVARLLPGGRPGMVDGRAALRLWLGLEGGRVVAADARVRVRGLQGRDWGFSRLAADLRWRRLVDGWRVAVHDLAAVARDGRRWPRSAAVVERRAGGWRVRADYVRLDDVAAVLRGVPGLPPQAARWAGARPRGVVRGLALDLAEGGGFVARARFEDVGLEAGPQGVSLTGLAGEVVATAREGRARLWGAGLALSLPQVLAAPVRLPWVEAALRWRREAPGTWAVEGFDLAAVEEGGAALRVQGRLGGLGGEGAWADLRGGMRRFPLARVGAYVPRRTPVGVARWLREAFSTGEASATALLRGPLRRLPFRALEGRLAVRARVEGGGLRYLPRWPAGEAIEGRIRIDQARLEARGRGRMSGGDVDEVVAEIPVMGRGARLRLRVGTRADAQVALAFLREAPFAKAVGTALADTEGRGAVRLDLGLEVLLRRGARPRLEGRAVLEEVALAYGPGRIRLGDVVGTLRFTESELISEGLRGKLHGRPVEGRVAVPLGERWRRERRGEVRLAGRADRGLLEALLPSPWWHRLAGETAWDGVLVLRGGEGAPLRLQARSDLMGVAVDLPPPFGKRSSERMPLTVDVELGGSGRRLLRARVPGRVALVAELLPGARVGRGELRLGPGDAVLPAAGFQIVGRAAVLEADAWRRVLAPEGAGVLAPGVVNRIVLSVEHVVFLGRSFRDVRVAARRADGYWRGTVRAEEVAGSFAVPARAGVGPLRLDLDRLHLAPRTGGAEGATDPRTLPALAVRVEDLRYGALHLGRLDLAAERRPWGLEVRRLRIHHPRFALEASGEWRREGGDERTALRGVVRTEDFGAALTGLGIASAVAGGRGTVRVELAWKGAPAAFELARLSGRVEPELADGSLVEVEPGAGRLLGLLSLGALPRRLLLDFRDFFKKGFAFDRLHGTLRLADGNAFSDPLIIEGPAARIELRGRTGLASRDYDQRAVMVPNLTSGLPVIGWIAGGPGAGAALFVLQRLFGRKIDEGARIEYHITGSWDAPRVERVRQPASPAPAEDDGAG